MLLANIAILLCKWKYKVLVIDWDLEAPGIESFFLNQLDVEIDNDNIKSKIGLIDVLNSHMGNDTILKFSDAIIEINLPQFGGELDLITSGKRDEDYIHKVRSFNLDAFYDEKAGGNWLEDERENIKNEYDFVLIDSRTGVTDFGGICTIQMPDIVVMVLTATTQSIDGTLEIGGRLPTALRELSVQRPIVPIFPVPSRFDISASTDIINFWKREYASKLSKFYLDILPKSVDEKGLIEFIEQIKIPYHADYSFGEKLPVLDGTSDPASIGYAFESVAALLADRFNNTDKFLENRESFVKIVSERSNYKFNTEIKTSSYKIFISSPVHLKEDQLVFGDLVMELNDRYAVPGRHVYFRLYKWEHDSTSFLERLKQDDYNNNIESCTVFILLYDNEIGGHTEEEYDFAYSRFANSGLPRIMLFKKENSFLDENVIRFEKKIKHRNDQFRLIYKNTIELRYGFFEEIQKLFERKIFHYGAPARILYNDGQNIPFNFKGREENLKVIHEKLKDGGRLMLINAEGGIGKTALAAKYWQDHLYDYAYNAWLFCENGIVNELKKLAPALGLDLSIMPEGEQISVLKTELQNISHSFLLVLDNANNEDDIIAFKQAFQGVNWNVLITSRCSGVLDPVYEYHINHLPPPIAKALFKDNYQEESSDFDALLDRLLAAIDYNTLLIEVFSKNLREASELGETLHSFINKLEYGNLYLSEQDSFEVMTDWAGHNKKMNKVDANAILDVLYDFTSINKNEEERKLLVNLSLLPAIPYELQFLGTLFVNRGKKDLRDQLKSLAKRGWVSFQESKYRVSQVIQHLALKKNHTTLKEDTGDLIDILNKKLENDGVYLKYFNEAGAYAVLVESITKYLIYQPFYSLGLLNFNACIFYMSKGDLFLAISHGEVYKIICEKLDDKNGLAVSYSKLGGISEKLGRLDQAWQYYQKQNKISEELHGGYPEDAIFKNSLAISYEALGGISEKLGRLEQALKYYEQQNKLSEELNRDHYNDLSFKSGLAISYEKLGGISERLNRLEQALRYYEQRNKLSEELYRDYPGDVSLKNGLAVSYSNLGGITEKLGRLEQALWYYEQRNKLSEELYRDYPGDVSFKNGLAVSYSKLGGINERLGRLVQARRYYNDDAKLTEELHIENPSDVSFKNGLSVSWAKLALLARQRGDYDEALALFEKAEKFWVELTSDFPLYVEFNDNLKRTKKWIASMTKT